MKHILCLSFVGGKRDTRRDGLSINIVPQAKSFRLTASINGVIWGCLQAAPAVLLLCGRSQDR